MREIEFRARDIETDKFVYGSYIDHLEIIKNEHDSFDIDVYTLGQYTGIKDKNGTKIFEGDIVRKQYFGKMNDISKYKDEKEFNDHKKYLIKTNRCIFDSEYEYHRNYDFVVKWDLNGFYPFADSPENCGHCGGAENNLECEVIGNIYDNPELIGGAK